MSRSMAAKSIGSASSVNRMTMKSTPTPMSVVISPDLISILAVVMSCSSTVWMTSMITEKLVMSTSCAMAKNMSHSIGKMERKKVESASSALTSGSSRKAGSGMSSSSASARSRRAVATPKTYVSLLTAATASARRAAAVASPMPLYVWLCAA